MRSSELTTEGGCIMWGGRVVIPTVLRKRVMSELHEVHPGMSRMKSLARSYFWWPGLDKDIEEMVRKCPVCLSNQRSPVSAPIHAWEYPRSPWERVHIDHAGPVNGKMFLILVDSFSKWIEVEVVNSTSSEATIVVLRKLFATHGLPCVLVSDNGPGFSSEEFNIFLSRNGVKHLYSAPYHPSSNGQAERTVRTFKESLKGLKEGSLDMKLSRFLFKYRITPQTTTGFSPAELLFNRRLRSALTLLKPDRRAHVELRQTGGQFSKKLRSFRVGDDVLAKNYGRRENWLPGKVVGILGATNYTVQLMDGNAVHRHIDQLLQNHQAEIAANPSAYNDLDVDVEKHASETIVSEPVMRTELPAEEPRRVVEMPPTEAVTTAESVNDSIPVEVRRSARPRRKPAYLEQYE